MSGVALGCPGTPICSSRGGGKVKIAKAPREASLPVADLAAPVNPIRSEGVVGEGCLGLALRDTRRGIHVHQKHTRQFRLPPKEELALARQGTAAANTPSELTYEEWAIKRIPTASVDPDGPEIALATEPLADEEDVLSPSGDQIWFVS